MRCRQLALTAIPAILLTVVSPPAAGQAPTTGGKTRATAKKAPAGKTWTPARTPWGDPDLQGVWNDATSTPLQRPAGKGEAVLDEQQADQFAEQLANDLSRDRRDGGNDADVNRAYNEHWMDARRLKITADRRTSLIVDPVDGRIPPLVAPSSERRRTQAARADGAARFAAGLPADFTDMSWPVRCVVRTDVPPYLPTIYNNNFQIFQSPGYVTIAPEMIHSARIIPVEGRPHLNKGLRQWLGDTRGHWEGATLVVETTNFKAEEGVLFQGANPATFTITERFTRVAPDSVNYEFTMADPTTWSK